MFAQQFSKRTLKMAFFLSAALAVTACSKSSVPDAGIGLSDAQNATPGSQEDFLVNVGDRVLFDTDSSTINDQGRIILDRQAQWLLRYGQYTFTIEGHADERGTREYNIALGARRATATRNYLVSKGVPASRMKTVSFGKERPVAVCNDISCWSQNRRSVTVLNGASS